MTHHTDTYDNAKAIASLIARRPDEKDAGKDAECAGDWHDRSLEILRAVLLQQNAGGSACSHDVFSYQLRCGYSRLPVPTWAMQQRHA